MLEANPPPSGRPAAPWLLQAFAGFAVLAAAIYRPALTGPLISDDFGYLVNHPYLGVLTLEGLVDIWNPWGQARLFAANYAPVHLTAHLLERIVFGTWMPGYHAVNVLLHALNSTLLVRLLVDSGLPRRAALLGGLFFLVHPANVEAVAWISQLKTSGALALALGALVWRRHRPALAALGFALALLTKATAVAALPMAMAFAWAGREGKRAWQAVGVWAALFALYGLPQLQAHAQTGFFAVAAYADPEVHLRSIAAIGARYLAMAASGFGIGAFQELPPARDPLDPWWLVSLPLAGLLLWRIRSALRTRSPEAGFWLGAAAGFAPVSQIMPFLYPIADRYLYFLLPGLIGGCAHALRGPGWSTGRRGLLRRGAAALLLVICAVFAVWSHSRAALWQSEALLDAEAARMYPEGDTARWLHTCEAGERGDLPAVLELLRGSGDGGASRFAQLLSDDCFARLRAEPGFQAFVKDAAGRWLESAYLQQVKSQSVLRAMAQAHSLRGETRKARNCLEEAIALGGPLTPRLRKDLGQLREQIGAKRERRLGSEARDAVRSAPPGGPDR